MGIGLQIEWARDLAVWVDYGVVQFGDWGDTEAVKALRRVYQAGRMVEKGERGYDCRAGWDENMTKGEGGGGAWLERMRGFGAVEGGKYDGYRH